MAFRIFIFSHPPDCRASQPARRVRPETPSDPQFAVKGGGRVSPQSFWSLPSRGLAMCLWLTQGESFDIFWVSISLFGVMLSFGSCLILTLYNSVAVSVQAHYKMFDFFEFYFLPALREYGL